jgi:flagellar protein FlaG
MTVPVSALSASPRHEPAVALSPAPQAAKPAERVREATALEHEKNTPEATPTQASAALDEINQALKMASIGVQFEFDKEANTMIAKVVDVETGQVIRQMPSEEMVQVSKVLGKLQGLLVSQKV